MQVRCPTCGALVDFDMYDVDSGGLLIACQQCGQEMRVMRYDTNVKVLFNTAAGEQEVSPSSIIQDPGVSFVRDSGSSSLLNMIDGDSKVELNGDTSVSDNADNNWGLITDPKKGEGISKPQVTETEIKRMVSMPPPEPPSPPSASGNSTNNLKPRPTAGHNPVDMGQTEVRPPAALAQEAGRAGHGRADNTPQPWQMATRNPEPISDEDRVTMQQQAVIRPRTKTIPPKKPMTGTMAPMPGEKSKGKTKTIIIATALVALTAVILVGVFTLLSDFMAASRAPEKKAITIMDYPDYNSLVLSLKRKYPQPGDIIRLLDEGQKALFVDTPASLLQATELYAEAIAKESGNPEAIAGYVMARMWDTGEELDVVEMKRLNDGLDFAIAIHGPSPAVLRGRALVAYHLGHMMEARKHIDYACSLEAEPGVECHMIRGMVFLSLEPHRTVEEMKAVLTFPSYPSLAYHFMGMAFEAMGHYGLADEMFDERLRLTPDHGNTLLEKGRLYAKIGRYDDCFKQLAELAKQDAFRVRAAILAAEIARNARCDSKPALDILATMFDKGFGDAAPAQRSRALVEYALLLKESGNNEQAVRMLKRSKIHLAKDYLRIILGYCYGLYSVNVGDGYLEFKDAATEIAYDYESDPLFNFISAFARYDAGLIKEAVSAFQLLGTTASKLRELPMARSLVFFESNNPNEGLRTLSAIQQYDPFLVLTEEHNSIFSPPGRLYQRLQDALWSDQVTMRKARTAVLYRGLAAFWLRKYDESARILGDAWKTKSSLGESRKISTALALSYIKLGKLKAAERVVREQLIIVPGYRPATLLTGYIQELKGHEKKAQASIGRFSIGIKTISWRFCCQRVSPFARVRRPR